MSMDVADEVSEVKQEEGEVRVELVLALVVEIEAMSLVFCLVLYGPCLVTTAVGVAGPALKEHSRFSLHSSNPRR